MRIKSVFAVAAILVSAAAARAEEVAYYRFEEGAADAEFPYPMFAGGPGSGIAVDSAGGDDGMRTWADSSNPFFRADVPAPVIRCRGAPGFLEPSVRPSRGPLCRGSTA